MAYMQLKISLRFVRRHGSPDTKAPVCAVGSSSPPAHRSACRLFLAHFSSLLSKADIVRAAGGHRRVLRQINLICRAITGARRRRRPLTSGALAFCAGADEPTYYYLLTLSCRLRPSRRYPVPLRALIAPVTGRARGRK
ncbi:hypothetical protein EVAR_11604_1 [Eumeta japonica]|uniref:Uncharacterized protein n=1 Tax=Eumeta variegata TaxID=151549 RepID=A0A4C1X7K6_EUMVA|nr:hypothetical protein EVAR_11604_1 [Eumeta japonica]